jgi:hypothetical protein
MSDKKFLQETNFQEDGDEETTKEWNAEKSNQRIKQQNERIWSDANLRDGSY